MIEATLTQPTRPRAEPMVHALNITAVQGPASGAERALPQQTHLCAMAAYASTLAHVRVLLGEPEAPPSPLSIRALPWSLRCTPLYALGLRLLALPDDELPDAIEAYVRAADEIPLAHRHPALQHLVDAARAGPWGLEQRERAAMRDAEAAVRAGDNVCNVCQRHGVTLPELRLVLETLSVRCHGWQAVADGASVAKIAALYGITLPQPLGLLASVRNLTRLPHGTRLERTPASMPC